MAKWIKSPIGVRCQSITGEWYETDGHECSNCGSSGWDPRSITQMFYCPNCGAKMDRHKDEDTAILYEADGVTEYRRDWRRSNG